MAKIAPLPHSASAPNSSHRSHSHTRDIRPTSAAEVRRACDSLLKQGVKPSVAAVRDFLGGGSPNTLTPLLSRYWMSLGERLQSGPDALEHVPEALARVTELFWQRALEEARERLKGLSVPDLSTTPALQDQLAKLSRALAEARAREGEYLSQLDSLSKDRDYLRVEKKQLQAILESTQVLLEQQNQRVAALEQRALNQYSKSRRPVSQRPGRAHRQDVAKARGRGSPAPRKSAGLSRPRKRATGRS